MITLKNEFISARIMQEGAELKSLVMNNIEYLWPGSADSWNASSPHLFPVIGMTIEGGWEYKGKIILMDNHGFARKSLFDIVEQSDESILFRLKDSEITRTQFPFPFILDIRYTLNSSALKVEYRVENPASSELLFSIGAHPGFNCPLVPGTEFEDYSLQFNKKESISRRHKSDYLTGKEDQVLNDEDRIDLNYDLFKDSAIIFSGLQSDSILLSSEKTDASVRMDFAGFPDFGIWTKQGSKAPYICLEPWYGVDSTEGDPRDFEKKEGLIRLKDQEEFYCSYTLTLT